jgi:hypothetical protein
VQLSCEATLNIAKSPEILALMREPYFCMTFCGVETPELAALEAMQKSQNRAVPLLEALATINAYGLEVVSGNHPWSRHGHATHRRLPDRIHRHVPYSFVDHQFASSSAEDTTMGSAARNRAPDRGARPGIQCHLHPPIR